MTDTATVCVVEHGNFEDADKLLGWMGGWFGLHQANDWLDYLANFNPDVHPYLEAAAAYLVEHGIRRGGDWHQREGELRYSDGTVLALSFRAWGDLAAAVWTRHDGKQYHYMDFYMDATLPEDKPRCRDR